MPSWLKRHPLIITGSWDSTPIFRLRRGGDPLWNDAAYTARYSLSTVKIMADAGVTLAVVDFMKCFGLAAEREIAKGLREFVEACKASGIRIGAYVGSTIAYETFLLEVPEASDWLVRGGDGNFLYYVDSGGSGAQCFRARMYFMHPGYRRYIKKVLREAIVEFGASEIHFDSASVMAAPEIFYHPRAVRDFRKYLRNLPEGELRSWLGASRPGQVLPPRFPSLDKALDTAVNDPLSHYWTEFRCEQLAAYFSEMREYGRRIDPEVAISVNTVVGISSRNIEWDGADHARLLPHVDILWNEEPDVAGIAPKGALTSKIRSYKMVAHAGKRMLAYAAGNSYIRTPLPLAESAAYNNQTLGMIGGPASPATLSAEQKAYVRFFRERFADCYENAGNVADIAVLHSFRSMAFNRGRPRLSSLLFEQALIQGKMLFDIVFDAELRDLSKYRVLVLPDQEILDDAAIALIEAFVRGGGGVVITEHTSLYDRLRRRRPTFGLCNLLPNVPNAKSLYKGLGQEDGIFELPIVRDFIGEGRAAYIPEVTQPASCEEHYPLPPNWEALLETVRWASGDRLSLEIRGPIRLTCEMTTQSGGARYLIHLLNYDTVAGPACGISVRFRIPAGCVVSAVDQLTPDNLVPASLTWDQAGGMLTIQVPEVITYTVLAVSLAALEVSLAVPEAAAPVEIAS